MHLVFHFNAEAQRVIKIYVKNKLCDLSVKVILYIFFPEFPAFLSG